MAEFSSDSNVVPVSEPATPVLVPLKPAKSTEIKCDNHLKTGNTFGNMYGIT